MLLLIVAACFTLVIAYIIYVLVTSYGSDYADNSFDAFVDTSASSENPNSKNKNRSKVDRYRRKYTEPGQQVLFLYGTEYGFSKELACELFDRIESLSRNDGMYVWQPRILNARHFKRIDWDQESVLLVTMSTAGDGVAPSDAREFVQWLNTSSSSLSHLKYSVLALGDSSYVHFCRAGRSLDNRLSELAAVKLVSRRDVDAEDRQPIESWFDDVTKALQSVDVETRLDYLSALIGDADDEDESASGPSRERPYFATLAVKYDLTKAFTGDDDKETIHCEFDVTGGNIEWLSGDALGIYPENCGDNVDEILKLTSWQDSQLVDVPAHAYQPIDDDQLPVRTVLLKYCDLKNISPDLLNLLRKHSPEGRDAEKLDALLADGLFKSNTVLANYLTGREVVDIVDEFRDATKHVTCAEFIRHLKMLQPRYYSISSSPLLDSNRVCVTAAVVRFETHDRRRLGIATTFLQDRLGVGKSCPVFISRNPDFRLPTDPSLPIIMIGPGTGFAPFRAFVQERIKSCAAGRNLLYFGCRRCEQDFLYRSELESWVNDGHLELRTAFSRDQAYKVYVQDLLRSDASAIWRLLDVDRAHLYICGDARHMASDVHRALLDILRQEAGLTDKLADQYLTDLETAGRYQKDVWIT